MRIKLDSLQVQVVGKPIHFKTEVVKDTCDPVWDAATEFRVSREDVLEFTISDYDDIGTGAVSPQRAKEAVNERKESCLIHFYGELCMP